MEAERSYDELVSIPYGSIKRQAGFVTPDKPAVVSIPYGSIKSFGKSLLSTSFSSVSIPYGSIKRKVYFCSDEIQALVSIPYGSIKSHSPRAASCLATRFQFLMVRLKVGRQAQDTERRHTSFNSLWFD